MAFNGCAKRSLRTILYNRAFSSYGATTHSNKLSSWTSKLDSLDRFSESPINTVANNPWRSVTFLRRFGSQVSSSDRTDLIKLLRERTCAPIKDVKAALIDSDWDIEEAQKELRKKGKVLASKKSDRTATEGLLALAKSESKAALIELNCETDFVARNDIYKHLALALAKQALGANPSQEAGAVVPIGIEQFMDFTVHLEHEKISGEKTVKNAITEVAAMMGENVKLGRGYVIGASENGVVSTYLHSSPQLGLGRIAGVITLEVEDGNLQSEALQRVGSELAMHVVAARPLFLTRELVTSEALQNEREVLMSQAKSSGKPQIAIEKMVEGRMGKYYEDVVLMEQKFIIDDSIKVKVLLDNLTKEVGSPVKIGSFFRMEVGEGVKRIKSDSTIEPVAQSA